MLIPTSKVDFTIAHTHTLGSDHGHVWYLSVENLSSCQCWVRSVGVVMNQGARASTDILMGSKRLDAVLRIYRSTEKRQPSSLP
jgi:hypothetical protein